MWGGFMFCLMAPYEAVNDGLSKASSISVGNCS